MLVSWVNRRVLSATVVLLALVSLFTLYLPYRSAQPNPANLKSQSAAQASADADLVFPTFDYTYDNLAKLSGDEKITKDPCVDVSVSDGGRLAQDAQGTTVLVTGGAGFIGSNLVDRLLSLGYKVRIYDNLYTGYIRNVPLHNESVEFFFGDILDRDALKEAITGVDYVYHLAAMSKVVPSLKSTDMARFCTESNALGSWNVLEAARQAGEIKKVIYAASSTYYGNAPAPHREDMAPDFLTPYAASKYEGEMQMQMFDRLFQVPTVSTRFFMVYGPRQPSTGAYAIVTGVFAKQAAEGKQLTIEGDGSHYRDFIHVSDIVEGLILSQQAPDLHGEVVNLGTGTAFSVQDVADLVSADQVHVDARKNDLEGTLADTCKMKRLLGYRARADFKTEMAYMAKQTMEGNVFMQPWMTPHHAISAPHLLQAGTPMFAWPKETSDFDALLLALRHISEKLGVNEAQMRQISIIPLSTTGVDSKDSFADLTLNTIFSLVRFGGVTSYLVAATDDDALTLCTTLNMPCYDARQSSVPTIINNLLIRGYDVHAVALGNSYARPVMASFAAFAEEHPTADVLGAAPWGDFLVRASERSRSAFSSWSESKALASIESLFNLDSWPHMEVTKATQNVEFFCGSQFQSYAPVAAPPAAPVASSASHVAVGSAEHSDSIADSHAAAVHSAVPEVPSSSSSSSLTPRAATSLLCADKSRFYTTVGCSKEPQLAQATNTTIQALKSAGAWHLSQCKDRAHCDIQQVVPLRWVSRPTDLKATGSLC